MFLHSLGPGLEMQEITAERMPHIQAFENRNTLWGIEMLIYLKEQLPGDRK